MIWKVALCKESSEHSGSDNRKWEYPEGLDDEAILLGNWFAPYPLSPRYRDHLHKFDGKADEGFFLGNGPDWLFDVDSLIISMNYVPVVAGNQTNGIAGTRDYIVTGQAEKNREPKQEFIIIPFCITNPLISQGPKDSEEDSGMKPTEVDESGASDKDGEDDQATRSEFERLLQQEKQTVHPNSTNSINTVSTPVSTAGPSCTDDDLSSPVNAAEASNAFEEHLFE
ncbi:hypothetical protein Tco_0303910 [Tanacetum coccineum]